MHDARGTRAQLELPMVPWSQEGHDHSQPPLPLPPPSSKKHNVLRPGTPVLLTLSGMDYAPVPINAHCGSWST